MREKNRRRVASQRGGRLAEEAGADELGNTPRRPRRGARPPAEGRGEVDEECFRARRPPTTRQVVRQVVTRREGSRRAGREDVDEECFRARRAPTTRQVVRQVVTRREGFRARRIPFGMCGVRESPQPANRLSYPLRIVRALLQCT